MGDPGTLLAALAVGILGGVHCLGMCGGIVGAISLGHGRRGPGFDLLLAYNLGRMGSYVIAGALAGWLGATLLGGLPAGQAILQGIAAVFLVLLGLYIGGWWPVLARLEQAGGVVWRRIEPLGRRFLPVRNAGQALLVGGLWGWLPCGLVYSVLAWSLSAGGATEGALLMAAFALGTLPNLLLMGVFAARMAAFVQQRWVRALAGAAILLYGGWMLLRLAM
ncbi:MULTISPECIES: sulfite exporter TauE/SafE family protein [unclassified Thioalkalivibrio]|uniref:sulfite exporter TauE/SafE family protein n=1 Tax=unclassified Thioalkalivibrio TaxID=2621013 RepID=UPI00037F565F|nr:MULTISPECIES: sulfite exporter TauE/SafE family protein [unclassified Thioalkalivibrio]